MFCIWKEVPLSLSRQNKTAGCPVNKVYNTWESSADRTNKSYIAFTQQSFVTKLKQNSTQLVSAWH